MSNKKGLKMDAFVSSVRPDPSSSEQVQLLQGYLGKSSLDGHVRVYFDEALNNFVEVPEADILHALPCDKSENALGGCRLWVKKSTVVTFGDPKAANRQKSSFLEGDLLTAYGNLGINPQGLTPFPTNPITTRPITTRPITTNITTTITRPPISWVDGCKSLAIPCFSINNSYCITKDSPICRPTRIEPQCRITRTIENCPPKSIQYTPCFETLSPVICEVRTIRNPCIRTIRPPECPIYQVTPNCFTTIQTTTAFEPNPVPSYTNLGQLGTQFRGTFNPYNY